MPPRVLGMSSQPQLFLISWVKMECIEVSPLRHSSQDTGQLTIKGCVELFHGNW